MIDPLIKKDLLKRHENPSDRRSILIKVTDSFERQDCISFEEFYTNHVSSLFEALSDSELEQLIELIKKIKS